jgi:hypothetical protein
VSRDVSSESVDSSPVTWAKLLEKHGVQYVAVNASGEDELLDHLRSSGCWEVRWEASGTVLLARTAHRNEQVVGSQPDDSR